MAPASPLATLQLPPALASCLVRPELIGRRPAVPTGLEPLDRLLGGGFPQGALSELIGPPSSGRTSLLLGTLAQVTAGGALAALVDATDGLDPPAAAAAGIVLDRVLWVRCGGRLECALRAVDVIVRGGGFGLVVLDLGSLPPWTLARVPSAALVRLQRAVEGTPAALLLAGARPMAGSLATVGVGLGRARPRWAAGGPGLLLGLEGEATLWRARGRAPGGVPVAWGYLPRRPGPWMPGQAVAGWAPA